MGDTDRDDTEAMVERILDEATCSVEELAAEAGLSAHTLWAWAKGRRNPREESLRQLAGALERRGERLTVLAKKLRDSPHSGR